MTTRRPQQGDFQIEPPVARHADVVPAVEDRSYIVFVLGALVMALLGGFLLSVVISLSLSGTISWGEERLPQMTQAHGWAQLQGWAGLFVAGMALRLMPRFAGRPPIRTNVTLPVFVLLFFAAAGRAVAQSSPAGTAAETLLLLAGLAGSAGCAAVGIAVGYTLARGRKRPEPWRYFAWAGAAWWLVWAAMVLIAAIEGARNDAFVPARLDDAMAWAVMLGAVGNFVFSVQSRSVPVFFGRRLPSRRKLAAPGALLNIGALLAIASRLPLHGPVRERLLGAGLALAGLGLLWLAPVAGSLWGEAKRLRPRARAAARYVLAANVSVALAGVLLAWAGANSLISGEFESFAARDAARHALGLGMITMLIIGMAQLVSPVFALERAEARPAGLEDHLAWWSLVAAIVLRVAAGLAYGHMDSEPRMHIAAAAGVLAWLGLGMFAFSVARAVRKEPRMKALLASAAGVSETERP
ncbi:MAG: NnrS family protein [Dehalococcoidia bacterium]|nr:NnrS family protein [Dehalococcoidia bacterium]